MSSEDAVTATQTGKPWAKNHPFGFLVSLAFVSLVVLTAIAPFAVFASLGAESSRHAIIWLPFCVAGASSATAAFAFANSRWSWLAFVYIIVALPSYTLLGYWLATIFADWNPFKIVI